MEDLLNNILSFSTLFLQVIVLISLVYLLISRFKKNNFFEKVINFISVYFLKIAFLLVLMATVGSLIYSEVVGLPPCDLCWIQRIFIYSLTLILGMAIFRKEEKLSLDLTVLFSGVGGVIAFYHYFFVQLGSSDSFICLPGSTNCSDILVSGFGYITIPLMALTIFSFLFIFSLIKKYKTLH